MANEKRETCRVQKQTSTIINYVVQHTVIHSRDGPNVGPSLIHSKHI